jgi:hypothetical protein
MKKFPDYISTEILEFSEDRILICKYKQTGIYPGKWSWIALSNLVFDLKRGGILWAVKQRYVPEKTCQVLNTVFNDPVEQLNNCEFLLSQSDTVHLTLLWS